MLYEARTILALIMARLTADGTLPPRNHWRYTNFAQLRLFDKTPLHLAHHPDDHVTNGAHTEFACLQDRFLAQNLTNNSTDLTRLWGLILNIKDVLDRGIAGDFAELGVWRGNTAAVLAHYAEGRTVYLFDTFQGFDKRDFVGVDATQKTEFADTSIDLVRETVADRFGVCRYVPGYFPGTLTDEHAAARYAVVSLDCDLQEPMAAALDFFYPRLTEGGIVFIHDYSNRHWPGIRIAVDAFCRRHRLYPILLPDKSGSAALRKATA